MLAAHATGFGTCPIGFARPRLNLAWTTRALAIPPNDTVVISVIVGYPKKDTPPSACRERRIVVDVIVCWRNLHLCEGGRLKRA